MYVVVSQFACTKIVETNLLAHIVLLLSDVFEIRKEVRHFYHVSLQYIYISYIYISPCGDNCLLSVSFSKNNNGKGVFVNRRIIKILSGQDRLHTMCFNTNL